MIYYTCTILHAQGIGEAAWSLYPPQVLNLTFDYKQAANLSEKDDPLKIDNWRAADQCLSKWNKSNRNTYLYRLVN